MNDRSFQPVWPLLSVTMAAVICAGAFGDSSVAPVLIGPAQADRISQSPERQSMGQWLSYWGRVVRQAHGYPPAIVSVATTVNQVKAVCKTVVRPVQPCAGQCQALTLPHLVDLPPPVV